MAEFVDTSVGLINIAHVLRVWRLAGPALRGNEPREDGTPEPISPNDTGIQLVDGRTLTCMVLGAVEWPTPNVHDAPPPLVGFHESEC